MVDRPDHFLQFGIGNFVSLAEDDASDDIQDTLGDDLARVGRLAIEKIQLADQFIHFYTYSSLHDSSTEAELFQDAEGELVKFFEIRIIMMED